MSSPTNQGTLEEIFQVMIAIEAPMLSAINPQAVALEQTPEADPENDPPFPFSARLPVSATWQDRRMAGATPWQWHIPVAVLTGFSSDPQGVLADQAKEYIVPLVTVYMENRALQGTVRNLTFEGGAIMGDIEINNIKYFGVQIIVKTEQDLRLPNSLVPNP